ncbi:MAG: toprim domain-containing protein [Candidatus Jorgensenbacteria bacterium]|nr:toprim domain-containing protein [Candidatus Jorgensenbacteria bacterium]
MIPDALQKFIDAFKKLPSFGPRTATRLAFHLVGLDRSTFETLITGLTGLKDIDRCPRCFFLKERRAGTCAICAAKGRDAKQIAIVEKDTDLLSIEKTGKWKGHYLVFGELPERGILETAHKLRLAALAKRIQTELGGMAEEIVLALNPTTFGDFAAGLIMQEFKNKTTKISRLGRGIPTGGEIEFADEETLGSALDRRT